MLELAGVDDVIGMFGEDTCNASGNWFISFFNEVELVICNGRQLVLEPEWTRVRPSLHHKSVIDFIVTHVQLMRESGEVNVVPLTLVCLIISLFGLS